MDEEASTGLASYVAMIFMVVLGMADINVVFTFIWSLGIGAIASWIIYSITRLIEIMYVVSMASIRKPLITQPMELTDVWLDIYATQMYMMIQKGK